jgi:hypothetical protein
MSLFSVGAQDDTGYSGSHDEVEGKLQKKKRACYCRVLGAESVCIVDPSLVPLVRELVRETRSSADCDGWGGQQSLEVRETGSTALTTRWSLVPGVVGGDGGRGSVCWEQPRGVFGCV